MNEQRVRELIREELERSDALKFAKNRAWLRAHALRLYEAGGVRMGGDLYADLWEEIDANGGVIPAGLAARVVAEAEAAA